MPQNLNHELIVQAVTQSKDVDGFTFTDYDNVDKSDNALLPCTPLAILRLLNDYKIDLKDKEVVIVGAGFLVGKPLAQMIL